MGEFIILGLSGNRSHAWIRYRTVVKAHGINNRHGHIQDLNTMEAVTGEDLKMQGGKLCLELGENGSHGGEGPQQELKSHKDTFVARTVLQDSEGAGEDLPLLCHLIS